MTTAALTMRSATLPRRGALMAPGNRPGCGVGARRRRAFKWALIVIKVTVLCLSSPSGRCPEGMEGPERAARRFSAHWRSHPLRPRLRQGFGEPTSPQAGKISTTLKFAPYSPVIHVVGGESSVFSGVDVRGASVDPAGSSGQGRQQTRVRVAPDPCSRINPGFTGLPHASNSSAKVRGDFGASPSAPSGHLPLEGEEKERGSPDAKGVASATARRPVRPPRRRRERSELP